MKCLRSIKLFLFLVILLLSQEVRTQNLKFGKINEDRLKEQFHSIDSSTSHAYIFKNCFIRYDFESSKPLIIAEYHYRVKIYTKEGLDEANVINYIYRDKKSREDLVSVKAECFNWVDGKIEKSKLSKKQIYKEELDENTTKVSFAIPNVREGSIIEYKYKTESPFIYAFPRHYFQMDVPVDYSYLKVDIPKYFTMAPSATGNIPLNRKKEVKTSYSQPVVQYTFDAKDTPGLDDDKYVLDIDDYRSSIKFELSEIALPRKKTQYFTKDWETICSNLMDSDYFGKALTRKVKPADDFLEEISSLEEADKLDKIVGFINSKVVWNRELGRYGTKNYNTLFEKGEGDVGEINLLLINLCKRAGLTAYPVLTKSRSQGLLNMFYPSLTELNYVFAHVEYGGKRYFVDATSTYFRPGTLPLRALNMHGILVMEDSIKTIELDNMNNRYTKIAGNYTLNFDEEKLEGSGKYILKDYAAVRARMKSKEEDNNEDKQDLVKDIDDEDEELDEEDVYIYSNIKGYDNKYGDIKGKFESELYSSYESIGDEVYIDAFVSLEFKENPFLYEVRQYPAFFNSKHHMNHVSIIEIPEGYSLLSKPDDIAMSMINNKGKFSYIITNSKNKVVVNVLFKINDDVFLPDEYASLHEFFNQVILKQKEKIVLVKE